MSNWRDYFAARQYASLWRIKADRPVQAYDSIILAQVMDPKDEDELKKICRKAEKMGHSVKLLSYKPTFKGDADEYTIGRNKFNWLGVLKKAFLQDLITIRANNLIVLRKDDNPTLDRLADLLQSDFRITHTPTSSLGYHLIIDTTTGVPNWLAIFDRIEGLMEKIHYGQIQTT